MHFDFVMGVQIAATARDLAFMVDSIPEGSTWTVAECWKEHNFKWQHWV